jgi:exodeoxyribonuclease V gamma subunit
VDAAIAALDENMRAGGMSAPVSAAVVVPALEALLDEAARGGVPTGAVTFAAIASLRNVPYRFIAVLGLNDGAFPSVQAPVEFDLMARAPRPTDRQRRSDDRNLFLDLILAARERLYLGYTGRSVRDNAVLPPSVVVAELLDYVGTAIAAPGTDPSRAARERLVVEHPLQPFSAEYFAPGADPRRVSYHAEYCAALAARADAATPLRVVPAPLGEEEVTDKETGDETHAPEPQAVFFESPLAAPGVEYRDVSLERLQRFFRNPCRYLLNERLALTLPWGEEELQDDEPFVADWRAPIELAQRVLPLLLAGRSLAEIRPLARATRAYPAGRFGDVELDVELNALATFAAAFAGELAGARAAPLSGTVTSTIAGETWRVAGELCDVTETGRIRYRYGEARAMDYLDGWIEHVFLNALAPPGVVARTTHHSRDGRYVLPPIADASEHLATLLALYREGLSLPLHFFPKAAWCYMTRGRRVAEAASVWGSPWKRFTESREASYRLALRGVPDPIDADFERCAIAVFEPMLAVIDDPGIRIAKPK